MKKFLFITFLCNIPFLLFASYIPIKLSGYNSDIVLTSGESNSETSGGGWSLFSDEKISRGGLPQQIRGLFSDVPYIFNDFDKDCAFCLSSVKGDASSEKFGSVQTVYFENSQRASSLWILGTATTGQAELSLTINYADGTSDDKQTLTVNNWHAESCEGTAFWQLGRIDAAGNIDNDYKYALFENAVQVSDTEKAISSVTIELLNNDASAYIMAITASDSPVPENVADKKLFFISNSHLDTQWNWTVKETIGEYIKNTLEQNFQRFDDNDSPNFQFNFEGAIKYMWAKEYYPEKFEQLRNYIKAGKWHISGGAVDANDVNIGSGESLIRNFLYGQTFYRNEFGVRGGRDIMLPDCFGFPWSLPTVAAHCGMKYFHSQKLSWNSAYAYNKLPRFARWIGTDGSELLSVLKLNPYDAHEEFRKDMSYDTQMLDEVSDNTATYGIPATVKYVGPRSDRGGGLDKETADWLSKSVDSDGPLSVSLGSTTEMLDQIFHMGYDNIPKIEHGLPMRAHGVGGYTSRCMLKYWLRKGELLADATEKASVMANWLGTLPYQQKTINNSWIRLLWHQFHDDIPGTSINEAYKYSVNDQVLNQLDLSRTLNNAVGGVAANLNTSWCENIPLVVYNPLSQDRTDIVEATINIEENIEHLKITDSDGRQVPVQIVDNNNGEIKFIFLATVPSLGYSTYNVSPTQSDESYENELHISENGMENGRYRISIDSNGDVCSIIDKQLDNKELLSAPIRLAMLYDESLSWPSWEIHGDQLQQAPREYVDNEGLNIEVAEKGPLRVSLKISRTKNGSTFYQYIRLTSAGSENRIDFVNEVDWQTRERLLKATFPLTASNAFATYDLSIGADVNANSTSYSTDTNNTDAHCEFLGHRWADVTNADNSFGVSILNDCKYGWDKQKDNEIRLTLIHTPKVGDAYTYQGRQDLGLNKFTYSFFSHSGKWNADTQWEADKLNQPMLAYQTTTHDGVLGSKFAFVKVNNKNVAVKALKKAEQSEKTIIRFYELTNQGQDVEVEFASDIVSAEEVNGVEEYLGPATFSNNKLTFHIDRFHPKTFAVELANPSVYSGTVTEAPSSVSVDMEYNVDVMSSNSNKTDADVRLAFPAELISDDIVADGISFKMGSRDDAQNNAVKCEGQSISLPSVPNGNKLYLLASSLNADGNEAEFDVEGKKHMIRIESYSGSVGIWSNSSDVKKEYRHENTAFTATHIHDTSENKDGIYEYLYMYKYVINIPEGSRTITLPNNPDILVYAITISDNVNDDTHPASQIVQVLNHTDTQDPYQEIEHTDPIVVPSSIKASSYTNNSERPEMASDGDEYTKWCDNSSQVKWIEYKFDRPQTITGWRVMNAGIESDEYIASEYNLQRHVNNGWVDVDCVYDNTTNTTDIVLEHPFVTSAVRLMVVSGEQSEHDVARIYEFSVYGHEPTEAEEQLTQIISRRPAYGFGKQTAKVYGSSGRVNAAEDPYNILDSDRKTKWCYNGSSNKPYVIVELSDIYSVDRFDIYDSRTMEDYDNSDEYTISVSTDGHTFTTVADEHGVASESCHTSILQEPVNAKFVKLEMSKGGGGAVRVYGFDIWGVLNQKTDSDNPRTPVSLNKTILGAYNTKNFKETALNLTDGVTDNTELTWNFNNCGASNPVNWVVLDLENRYDIRRFIIYDSKTYGTSNNITGYRIYVSDIAPTDEEMAEFHKTTGGSKWTEVITSTSDDRNIKTIDLDDAVAARYVKLEIPYRCVTDSAQLYEFEVYGERIPTGMDKIDDNSGINVYPNVVNRGDYINVIAPSGSNYVMCNLNGSLIDYGKTDKRQVSTSTMQRGIYLLTVKSRNNSICKKIIIK